MYAKLAGVLVLLTFVASRSDELSITELTILSWFRGEKLQDVVKLEAFA
jgi:hypothetical protein